MMTERTPSSPVFSVTDAVVVLNQTLEYAYPTLTVVGELSSFRVSKNKWLFFDLKDEMSNLKFFGTVYALPGPLEDGMLLEVVGIPRVHPQFGFSINIISIKPVGEGSLRKAADLLQKKLAGEGLFDPSRKRRLPYPPEKIGLIASEQSAGYADFVSIINNRWGGMEIELFDVQVQGEQAPEQLITAINWFNQHAEPPEVLIITRGGGSLEDLASFNNESLVRAVAASRIPTLVAIGHEIDFTLAELAADVRAATPSNAAELLVPDRVSVKNELKSLARQSNDFVSSVIVFEQTALQADSDMIKKHLNMIFEGEKSKLDHQNRIIQLFNPHSVLKRGYTITRKQGKLLRLGASLAFGDDVSVEFSDSVVEAKVQKVIIDKDNRRK